MTAQQIDPRNLTPEQIQKIIAEQCIFCKIIKGEIPSKKVYEDEHVVAFLDINPANLGHTLIVPRKHFAVLPQMPDTEIDALFRAVKRVSAAVFEAVRAQGINVLQNNGAAAGQEVPHVHVHIIPRFQDDKVTIPWQARPIDDSQMIQIQGKIYEKLRSRGGNVQTLPTPHTPPPIQRTSSRPAVLPQEPDLERLEKPEKPEKKIKMKPKRP